jgi:hypothetical protein
MYHHHCLAASKPSVCVGAQAESEGEDKDGDRFSMAVLRETTTELPRESGTAMRGQVKKKENKNKC